MKTNKTKQPTKRQSSCLFENFQPQDNCPLGGIKSSLFFSQLIKLSAKKLYESGSRLVVLCLYPRSSKSKSSVEKSTCKSGSPKCSHIKSNQVWHPKEKWPNPPRKSHRGWESAETWKICRYKIGIRRQTWRNYSEWNTESTRQKSMKECLGDMAEEWGLTDI